ncbi:MAG: ABC transporter permease [Chloracidobacterium sp.]|nr:ABC transporter permease [Chloracidobacterium sp.]
MSNDTRKNRFHFWLWLIRIVGVIVPRRLRAGWRHEWEAELGHREELLAEWDRLEWRSKLDLLRRSTSAFWDALWLQPKRLEDEMFQDLRYGARMLMKNPGLTFVIVLLLALGIGVNTGVFTALNGLIMRARVDNEPDSFIHLAPQYAGQFEQLGLDGALSLTDYQAFQSGAHSLSDLAGWAIARVKLDEDTQSQMALMVTRNFFSVYGLERPKLGRLFLAEECAAPGGAQVAVLSEELWQSRFGADPQIIGKVISLNRRPFTIVGVTPARFSGRLRGWGIWIPYTMQPQFKGGENLFQETGKQWLTADGRIRPGQSRASAQAELALIARRQDQLQPGRKTTMVLTNGSLIEEPTLRAKVFWVPWLIMGALSLLLLITCVNVTLLLLAKATARRKEMAIRLALGAGRRRLARMLLTESLIFAASAGAISAWLAYQTPIFFEKTFVEAPNYPLEPNWPVFVYLAGVTLLSGCLAGLSPALEALKVNLSATLNGNVNLFGAGKTGWSGRDLLISAQVAMSMVLLVFAGIFLRAYYAMVTVDPGFEPGQVLLAPLQAEPGRRYTAEAAALFNRALEQRVRALPGVQSVCFADAPPGAGGGLDANLVEIRIPGQEKGSGILSGFNIVSAEFFETFRIPIVAGRPFFETEDAASAVIVSETFARSFWGKDNSIGKAIEDESGDQLQVVGVARDARSNFDSVEGPQLYRHFNPRFVGSTLMIRFAGEARPTAEAVGNVIRGLDSQMIIAPQTLRSVLDKQAAKFEVVVRLILLPGLIAMLIAAIGTYSAAAFAVNHGTKEMGIRLALGATRNGIIGLVLRSGFKPIIAGLAAGLLFAAGGSIVLARVLRETPVAFEISDPLVYLAVSLLLSLAALAAMLGPARRAAKTEPMLALRQD